MSLRTGIVPVVVAVVLSACAPDTVPTAAPYAPRLARIGVTGPVNVSQDTTAQNETPIAVNPTNPLNLLTGNNDWNYNDGCGVNASFDGGRTWTPTLPSGFIPGITRFTNDPSVPGAGPYDFGGDPYVAFGPDGTAYFACFGYQATQPFGVVLLLSRSHDGGRTWLAGGSAQPLTVVSAFNGNGAARGSTGQFPDHDAIWAAKDGTIYATWAQFNGHGSHSPVFVSVSRDGGLSFAAPVKVGTGSVRSDQDGRVVTDPRDGTAYLTFDNGIQGGKGTAMFVSVSHDRGASWSAPAQLATFVNPVCLFPPGCFNISGGQFRAPGSYPAPAFDPVRGRIYVAYTDIVNGLAQIFLTYASAGDPTHWSPPAVVAPASGDRINVEISIDPGSGRIDLMTNDRSYASNQLFDVTYLTSADGGQTWATQRVTRTSWDPSHYGVPAGGGTFRPFIGDYDGIASLTDHAAIVWTGPGPTVGAIPDNLDVFYASAKP
jgi:hypothetical protein